MIPLSVLALGLLSVGLLVWTRQMDERGADDAAMAEVVMDFRIRADTAHLWAEQISAGATSRGERPLAESALLDTEHLAHVLCDGGEGKGLLVMSPPYDPEVRQRAEKLEGLTSEWVALTRARLRGPEGAVEGSPSHDRGQAVFDELQHEASDLGRIIEADQAAVVGRSRRLFQALLLGWSIIVVASTTSLFQREQGRAQAEDALRAGRDRLEQMVADKTSDLRRVNMAVLTAQEMERRRISTELHDQLGHSLVLMKFQIARVTRQLMADQSSARSECAELSGYIDQTLEDVRRVTRDLRPLVLERRGLSAALRWLADSCGRNGRSVTAAIADIDPLVPRDVQVIVYRIVQQALTNAARHSDANQVSLRVAGERDRLRFVVEDDGRGFDLSQAATTGPACGCLGLTTMQERASMAGGTLEVWSEIGRGTRVTLVIPSRQETTT